MPEEKCFAEMAYRGKCAVLTVGRCPGHNKCRFFKTEEQVKQDKEKCFERFQQLPFEQQIHISKTYYGGRLPWEVIG